ncbi:hypothetical protein SETIT_8G213600v2 [Setaria italica]|uniref:Leucine-rich repeat-containing N-terminal plant-type domain-containing protein n=2 Tax=Setaria italica TaxID=4555 RepID=A0A368SAC6_SETIT|nr:hypothetical protein SETIT_8G213600v2 [Setaria italica]
MWDITYPRPTRQRRKAFPCGAHPPRLALQRTRPSPKPPRRPAPASSPPHPTSPAAQPPPSCRSTPPPPPTHLIGVMSHPRASPPPRRPRLLLPLLLLLLAAAAAEATLHPVDYLALQAVRRALSDLPGSRFFASWDFTADPCGFAGVSCSPDGSTRVVALALGDPRAGAPGLSGPFPSAAVSKLSALASLSLVPGRVTGALSPAVAALPALRFLALAGNLLSGDLPPAFAPGLRTVDLSKNAFTGRVPPSLLQLRDLRTLVLSHNALSGEIPRSVRAPLVHLDLRSNRLSGGVPPLPGTLMYLSLAGNRLSGQVGAVLRRLPRLAFLDLGRNWFSGEVPGELFAFRIGYLQLRKNAFSGELRPTGRVAAGATVDLSHNALSGRVPPELATAGAVYLNGNRFAGEVPREVAAAAEAGRMRVLFLQDNFLTGIAVGGVPASAAVCAHWNCVAPPPAVVAACPAKGGRGRRRPQAQCGGRRG